MIDFKEKRFDYKSICKEDEEMLELRSADILKDLENEKTNFFYLGVYLIDLYNSGAYRVYAKGITCEQMRIDYNLSAREICVPNISSLTVKTNSRWKNRRLVD